MFKVAVSVGAVPPVRLTVANQAVIVLTVVQPCKIETINGCVSVAQVIVNVIAVQEVLPVTTCILLTEQSNATA